MSRLWTAPEENPLADRTVLLVGHPRWVDPLVEAIQNQGGHPLPVDQEEEVFSLLKFEQPEFIILSEGLGPEGSLSKTLLEYLQKMPTRPRRDIFVVWVGNNVKSGDWLSAFSFSVNLVMQADQLSEIITLIKKSWSQWKNLYQVFLQSQLQLTGP